MNATAPGLAIYSDEWMSVVGKDIARPLRPVVQRICREYNLGDSRDPALLARIIEEELTDQLGEKIHHRIEIEPSNTPEDDVHVPHWEFPVAIQFDHEAGWFYVSDLTIYKEDEIVEETVTP